MGVGEAELLVVKGETYHTHGAGELSRLPSFPNLKYSSKFHIIVSIHNTSSQDPIWNFNSHPILLFILCVGGGAIINDIFQVLIPLLKMKHDNPFYVSGKVWAIH